MSSDQKTPRTEFEIECLRERGRVLIGDFAHWCDAWDGMTMDETCIEFPCECYRDDVYWVERDPCNPVCVCNGTCK